MTKEELERKVKKQLYRISGLEKNDLHENLISRYASVVIFKAGEGNGDALLDGLEGALGKPGIDALSRTVELAERIGHNAQQ